MTHCAKCKHRMDDTCYVYAHDLELGASRLDLGDGCSCGEFEPVRVTRAKTVQVRDVDFERGRPCWTPFPLRKLRKLSAPSQTTQEKPTCDPQVPAAPDAPSSA